MEMLGCTEKSKKTWKHRRSKARVFFIFYLTGLLLYISTGSCLGKDKPGTSPIHFIEPEAMIGKVVPNKSYFPETGFQYSYFLNIGHFHALPGEAYSEFYNFPYTGVNFSYSTHGNKEAFGESFAIIPYITLRTSKDIRKSFDFKLGLGASYFTKFYHETKNPRNKSIGSGLNWSFQAFLYHNLIYYKNFSLRMGAGYLHNSNGHVQLPNFGLNSGILSISAKYLVDKNPFPDRENHPAYQVDKQRQHFYHFRYGWGIHEFGGTAGPVGGPKKSVFSLGGSRGIIFRQFIKASAGFSYRFYEHYYDFISREKPEGYKNNPFFNASNFYFFMDCEFLIKHFAFHIEGGLNLHKPFYEEYKRMYEHGSQFDLLLKKLFLSRVGFKYYLLDTRAKPLNNWFISAHVNANFGEADFTNLSLGYCRSVGQ